MNAFLQKKSVFKIIIFLLGINFISFAQTTLINPSGNGGFETGATFAANSCASNMPASATVTQWTVGSIATAVNAGTNSAYITKDRSLTPPNYSYIATTASVSHMWFDVSVPSTENLLTLAFNWKCLGEGIGTKFDYFKVWIVPQTVTPVYGTAISPSGVVPGQDNVLIGDFNNQSTWQSYSNNSIYGYAGKSIRLVFEWINNSATIGTPPAAIDNISLVSSVPTVACTPGADGSTPARRINSFATSGGYTNINNITNAYSAGGYGDFYSSQFVEYFAGGQFAFSLANNGATSDYSSNIYIDWNLDNDFMDVGEKVWSSGGTQYRGTKTGTIAIPTGQAIGNYRMRVVSESMSSATDPFSCGTLTKGEYEDYKVKVIPIPSCIEPNVTASTTSSSSALATWTAPGFGTNPVGYEYVINTTGTTPVGSGTATTLLSQNFTGLAPGTYYVFVRSNCGSGVFSAWDSTSFTLNSTYCTITSSDITGYISNFTTTGGVANINNTTTGSAYSDFTAMAVSQYAGSSISFSLTPLSPSTYGMRIWVDWNKDFSFNDSDELVFFNNNKDSTVQTGVFTIPSYLLSGNYRIRVVANTATQIPSSCGTITKGECEDYTLTILVPPTCSANPSNVSFFATSQTAGNLTWTAPATPPANGYAYYYNTTGLTPTFGQAPTGTVAAGVTSVNLTGLSSSNTYYAWVRSICASGNGIWYGPLIFSTPVCAPGSGNGTTTLQCPTMVAGGIGLNGANPAPINCNASTTTTLEAVYNDIKTTTSYTVSSTTYAPPYQFDCLRNRLFINKDDVYSPVVNLPFNFCFFGNSYNKCVIGANGLITFDTSLAYLYSGWEFANNIPSQSDSLKPNSIFGVYQDIDPRQGGEIGWELITLNNGCRALVVAYNNVPYYNNAAKLYTGMMVLYENTNIIDIYVKNKEIVSTWNDGNAIIGIQNSSATVAVVAPGKNSLDTNWSAINQAWRFTPNGSSLATVNWYEGTTATGAVLGTGNTLTVTPTSSTTYTAEITYNLCNGLEYKITDQAYVEIKPSSTWNGSVSTNWNNATNWTPAVLPTLSDCVLIPDTANDPIISGINYTGLAGNITIQANAKLTVNSNNNVKITNWVNVNSGGELELLDDANMVQINDVANIGNIKFNRTTSLKKNDYVQWSSPVTGIALNTVCSTTSYLYKYLPTVSTNVNGHGTYVSSSEVMNVGEGYLVGAPSTFTSTAQNYSALLVGVPYNGTLNVPVSRGTYNGASSYNTTLSPTLATKDDDNWNLLGNPYPSSISADAFLSANSTILDGAVYLWTHGTSPSAINADPFYNNYGVNYSESDFLTYNLLGGTQFGFDGYIAAGQGFFTLMKHSTGSTTENVQFTNVMRSESYRNDQFFRSSSSSLNKSRIWLNISNGNSVSNSLVGYTSHTTNEFDELYDNDISGSSSDFKLYSLIEHKRLDIQGRAYPYERDIIPLGFVTNDITKLHKISLQSFDGAFVNAEQPIYLEDKLLKVVYNLKNRPYEFTTSQQFDDNRFVLKFQNSVLSQNDFETDGSTLIYENDGVIKIKSSKEIANIIVHDITGKLLFNKVNVQANEFDVTEITTQHIALIVKVTCNDGTNRVVKLVK